MDPNILTLLSMIVGAMQISAPAATTTGTTSLTQNLSSVSGVEYSVQATVTINPIYDLSLETEVLTKRVLVGDDLNVSIKLNKTDLIEVGVGEEITVYLYYEIFKPRKGKEPVIIEDGFAGTIDVMDYKEETIPIPVPLDIKPGKYVLKIEATHPQAYSASDEDDFYVKKKIPPKSVFTMLLEFLGF